MASVQALPWAPQPHGPEQQPGGLVLPIPWLSPVTAHVRAAHVGDLARDVASIRFRRQYAARVRTGCVYTPQPRSTYSALLIAAPRFSREYCHYTEWCPGLAPHPALLVAYQAGRLSWPAFARRYLAGLELFPTLRDELRRRVVRVLARSASLMFLGQVPGEEATVRCHRRLLRAWLLGERVLDVVGQD
jgi:uncharacterized protein YeaO (DUF488 family)